MNRCRNLWREAEEMMSWMIWRGGSARGGILFFDDFQCPTLHHENIRRRLGVFPISAATCAMCEASGGHEERLRQK
jgi:hypothetical protein